MDIGTAGRVVVVLLLGALLFLAPSRTERTALARARPTGSPLKSRILLGAAAMVAVAFVTFVLPALRGEPGRADDLVFMLKLYVPLGLVVAFVVHRLRPGGNKVEPWVMQVIALSVLLAFVAHVDVLLHPDPPRSAARNRPRQARALPLSALPSPADPARAEALFTTRCERARRYACFGESPERCASHDYYATCSITGEPDFQDALNAFTLVTHQLVLRTQVAAAPHP